MLTWSPFDNTNLLLYNKRSIFKIFMTVGALHIRSVTRFVSVLAGETGVRTVLFTRLGSTAGAPAGASKTPKTGDWAYSRLGASSESPQWGRVGASLNGRKKNGVKITFLPAIFPARLDFPRSYYLPLAEDEPGVTVVYLPSKYLIRQQFQDQGLPSPLLA